MNTIYEVLGSSQAMDGHHVSLVGFRPSAFQLKTACVFDHRSFPNIEDNQQIRVSPMRRAHANARTRTDRATFVRPMPIDVSFMTTLPNEAILAAAA